MPKLTNTHGIDLEEPQDIKSEVTCFILFYINLERQKKIK